jgi:rhamnulokinase
MSVHLAIDLGAESGRVIGVWMVDGRVQFLELHRFGHRPVQLPSGLHWNITQIWSEIVTGLQQAARWAQREGLSIVSVGADAWGVDWGLINGHGELVGLPHAYRDPRNARFFAEAVEELSIERIYQTTGIQLMQINSLYSLLAMTRLDGDLVAAADRLLFIPDLIHFWLSGVRANERTIASTSQMVDPRSGDWASDLLEPLGISREILGEIVPAGTRLGTLRPEVAVGTGLSAAVEVIAPGSHDTASAVAAVPAEQGSAWCFLSSGTWSLLGCELDGCLVNAEAQTANFTNEAGIGSSIRFLKNIAGLWLVQECRRAWQQQGQEYTYEQLTELAAASAGGQTLVNPDWAPFQLAGEMPQKIQRFARETGQPVPESPGAIVRCALESLALAYRKTIETMERITGKKFTTIHVVGGGGKNGLLNQLTADYCQCLVIAGPTEATALGNGLVQAMARGQLSGLDELRRVVRESCEDLIRFEPHEKLGAERIRLFQQLCQLEIH